MEEDLKELQEELIKKNGSITIDNFDETIGEDIFSFLNTSGGWIDEQKLFILNKIKNSILSYSDLDEMLEKLHWIPQLEDYLEKYTSFPISNIPLGYKDIYVKMKEVDEIYIFDIYTVYEKVMFFQPVSIKIKDIKKIKK